MRHWQDSWDRLMATYQPNREQGLRAVFDAVEALVEGRAPRILDLGGGTGSVCQRALARWPAADLTLLDLDPVLLRIASGHLPPSVVVVHTDLRDPDWPVGLPHPTYDAVLAVMALHYLAPGQLATVYTTVAGLLRPGGLLVNMDHMPDPGLPQLSERLVEHTAASRQHEPGWDAWWAGVAADPDLGPAAVERAALLAGQQSAEWMPPVSWHLEALQTAGYAEVGLGWRHGTHAAVVAITARPPNLRAG